MGWTILYYKHFYTRVLYLIYCLMIIACICLPYHTGRWWWWWWWWSSSVLLTICDQVSSSTRLTSRRFLLPVWTTVPAALAAGDGGGAGPEFEMFQPVLNMICKNINCTVKKKKTPKRQTKIKLEVPQKVYSKFWSKRLMELVWCLYQKLETAPWRGGSNALWSKEDDGLALNEKGQQRQGLTGLPKKKGDPKRSVERGEWQGTPTMPRKNKTVTGCSEQW